MARVSCNGLKIFNISQEDLQKIIDPQNQNTFHNNLQILKRDLIQDHKGLIEIKNKLIKNNKITEKEIDEKITLCISIIDSIDNINCEVQLQYSYRKVYNFMHINSMNMITDFIGCCEQELERVQ